MARSSKQTFLETLDREHAITRKVLAAMPKDRMDFKPAQNCRTARELAMTFVGGRLLGIKVLQDAYAKGIPSGESRPKSPETMDEILGALEKANREYREVIESYDDDGLRENVHFFVAPKELGEYRRMDWIWILLHDEIHHRGQFSIYVRAAGGKVPSIYGPTADEPWV